MKKFFKVAVLVLTLMLIQTKIYAKAVEENRQYFPPVLMYHDIRETPLNLYGRVVKRFYQAT